MGELLAVAADPPPRHLACKCTAPHRHPAAPQALLIYIPEPQAAALVKTAVEEATAAGATAVTFAFADKLPGMREGRGYVPGPPKDLPGAPRGGVRPAPSCAYADAAAELRKAGLVLEEATWQPKPGLARHMGVARTPA